MGGCDVPDICPPRQFPALSFAWIVLWATRWRASARRERLAELIFRRSEGPQWPHSPIYALEGPRKRMVKPGGPGWRQLSTPASDSRAPDAAIPQVSDKGYYTIGGTSDHGSEQTCIDTSATCSQALECSGNAHAELHNSERDGLLMYLGRIIYGCFRFSVERRWGLLLVCILPPIGAAASLACYQAGVQSKAVK